LKRVAFFPGSFDPFTRGHEDIVRRGLSLFDEIIIGIGTNTNKKRYFEADFMANKITQTFAQEPVRVVIYDRLTAVEAATQGAKFLLRGLRNTTDFEYENAIAQVNKEIVTGLETVLLITTPSLAPISSTIIRDLHRYGTNVNKYLPYALD
jgi:pantetheine-phosphate adenylyltransferase